MQFNPFDQTIGAPLNTAYITPKAFSLSESIQLAEQHQREGTEYLEFGILRQAERSFDQALAYALQTDDAILVSRIWRLKGQGVQLYVRYLESNRDSEHYQLLNSYREVAQDFFDSAREALGTFRSEGVIHDWHRSVEYYDAKSQAATLRASTDSRRAYPELRSIAHMLNHASRALKHKALVEKGKKSSPDRSTAEEHYFDALRYEFDNLIRVVRFSTTLKRKLKHIPRAVYLLLNGGGSNTGWKRLAAALHGNKTYVALELSVLSLPVEPPVDIKVTK